MKCPIPAKEGEAGEQSLDSEYMRRPQQMPVPILTAQVLSFLLLF